MSIATQIQRIQGLVNTLRTKIQNKGVTLANDADLEDCVDAIDDIEGGGGSSSGGFDGENYLCFENLHETAGNDLYIQQLYYTNSGGSYANTFSSSSSSSGVNWTYTLEYSFDKETWTAVTHSLMNAITTVCTIPGGSKVYVRSSSPRIQYKASSNSIYYNVKSLKMGLQGYGKVSGDIRSLLMDSNGLYNTEWQFKGLFYQTGFKDASQLVLGDCTSKGCFSCLFQNCSQLQTPPSLPATKLTEYCYQDMFNGCSALTSVPALPATTLANACYYEMFRGCTNITTAPDLLATQHAEYCYYGMFNNCTNLNYVKCLLENTGTGVTTQWMTYVAASGTFIKNPNATFWQIGNANGIPAGWTATDAS